MQYAHPVAPFIPKTGPWTRKRHHQPTRERVAEPVTSLYETEHDAWKTGVYDPDAVWLEAVAEYHRRLDLYMQCKPF